MNEALKTLRRRLTKKEGIDFRRAADVVIQGKTLPSKENAGQVGRDIYIASHDSYQASLKDLESGITISDGAVEKYRNGELRVYREGKELRAAVYKNDIRISMELSCESTGDAADEGFLTWFGPVEDICTPWSDNDPAQCQVVTLDDLREYAEHGVKDT